MDKNNSRLNHIGIISIILLAFLYAIRMIALYFPGARAWGFNHLQFLPGDWSYIYIAAGIFIVLMGIFSLRGHINRHFEKLSPLLSRRYYLSGLIFSLIAVFIFWFLRMPTNLLGDGYSVINNIGGEIPVVFKWSEEGSVRIIYWVSLLLPFDGLARGEYAYAIVSVLSGGAAVYFLFCIAKNLTDEYLSQLLILGSVLFSGSILLFFGYAENYPVLWPLSLAYILASVRYIQGKCGIIIPAVLILVGIYLHLQMAFFALSFLGLIFSRDSGQKFYRKNKKAIWSALILISGIFIYLFLHKYYSSIAFRSHILPLWQGKPLAPEYAILSVKHFVDLFNLYLLIIPLSPVLIIFAWKSRRLLVNDAINRFLLLFSIGGLILVFLIDPRLGMARDWDLFALAGLGPSLLLTRMYIQSGNVKKLYPILIIAALVLTLPYLATNLKKEPSLAYMQSLMDLDESKSRPGMVMLVGYLRNIGDNSGADQTNAKIVKKFPQPRWERIITQLLNTRELDRAMIYADSLYNYNPYSADCYNIYSQIYTKLGKYDSALAMIKITSELSQYESRVFTSMATIYRRMKNNNEMWKNFRQAQKLNPHEYSNLMLMSQSFVNERIFDSAIAYNDILKSNYPDSIEAYLAAGVIYRGKGEFDKAIHELEIYISRLEHEEIQNNILQMIDEIKNMQK